MILFDKELKKNGHLTILEKKKEKNIYESRK